MTRWPTGVRRPGRPSPKCRNARLSCRKSHPKRKHFGRDDLGDWLRMPFRFGRKELARVDCAIEVRSVLCKLGGRSFSRGVGFECAVSMLVALTALSSDPLSDMPRWSASLRIGAVEIPPTLEDAIERFREARLLGRDNGEYPAALDALIVTARLCQ